MTISKPNSTVVRQPWLNIARIVWVAIFVTAMTLGVIGLVRAYYEPLPTCALDMPACAPWTVSREDIEFARVHGLPHQLISNLILLGFIIPKLAFVIVGVIIFWKRSDDWVAWLLSLMLVLFVLEGIFNLGSLMILANTLYALSSLIFGIVPFIFPNGRFVPPWMSRYAIVVAALTTIGSISPQYGLELTTMQYSLFILGSFSIWFVLCVYSVIYRYRYVSTASERQQTKWVISGLLFSFVLFIPFGIITFYFPPHQPSLERLAFLVFAHYPLYLLTYMLIPGSIAFSILRYRLWDIDIIIRRTLQYSALTGLLAAVYFGAVVLLQSAFRAITGSESQLAVAVSTLGIAALFNPLRHRLQGLIDQQFFRRKYSAEIAMSNFATMARDEVDIENLSAAMFGVVNETMKPEKSSLWLRQTPKGHP